MYLSTLCYIENEAGEYLMLHRVKKKNDLNHDKWVGVGGKFEVDESPEECVVRETLEETGLTLTDYRLRGLVTFLSSVWETEYMGDSRTVDLHVQRLRKKLGWGKRLVTIYKVGYRLEVPD